MDFGALITLGASTVLTILGSLILRNVTHIDQRLDRGERKRDADMEKIDEKLGDIHARVTDVATAHAQLRGEFNAATRPDSKSGIRKFNG